MTGDVCDQICDSPTNVGWFDAYPEKQSAFRDLAETIDTAAVSIISTKQPIMPSVPIARG